MNCFLIYTCLFLVFLNILMANDVWDIIFAGINLVVMKLAFEMHALNEELEQ